MNEAVTQQEAADLLNVGKSSVERAREVLDHGAPELVAAVESGAVAVSTAAAIADAPVEEQRVILALTEKDIVKAAHRVKRQKKARRQAARQAARRRPLRRDAPSDGLVSVQTARYRVQCSDVREARIGAGEVDCILTDPPYAAEHLEGFRWLAERAGVWLRPGGILAGLQEDHGMEADT